MKKSCKIIFGGIICTLFPALFSYLGQSNNALDWLQKNNLLGSSVDIEIIKDVCVGFSVILSFVLLTIPLILSKMKLKLYLTERDDLLVQWKDIFVKSLSNRLSLRHMNMDIRIFVPRVTLLMKLYKIIKSKKYKLKYVIRNFNVFANRDTTEDLAFEVYPKPEGLVGQCYKDKTMYHDDNLTLTNSTLYNLSESQIFKTQDLKFSLVCPILNSSNEIISIIAFDTKQDIKLDNPEIQKAIENSVLNFSQMLYSRVPELFKKEGGLK